MFLTPSEYQSSSVYDLLVAAAHGRVGFDRRLVHAIVDRPKDQVIPDLLKFGLGTHEDDPIPLDEDLVNIVRHIRAPEGMPLVAHIVRLFPAELPDDIVDAVLLFPQAAVEPFLEVYNGLEEEEGSDVAFLLAATRVTDGRILKLLLDRLEYDLGDAALALGLYGDVRAKEPLEKALRELGPDDAHLRQDIKDAIEQLGRPREQHESGFDIWAAYPEKSGPVAAVLSDGDQLELLVSPDAEYRAIAARGFAQRDVDDRTRAKLFKAAQNDSDAEVRGAAWEALADEVGNQRIYDAMLERVKDASAAPAERLGALIGVSMKMKDAGVGEVAEEFYKQPETRARALRAMWRSFDRRFAKYFPQHLDDPNEEIRRQAIYGVGYLGIANSAERLTKLFEDDDWRLDAIFNYALSVRADISPGRIRSLYKQIEDRAGGLGEQEEAMLKMALDERLALHGKPPVFEKESGHVHGPGCGHTTDKVGRNDPCPCGSGKKYKKCCGSAA